MTKINPAILTEKPKEFNRQLKIYSSIFEEIDIDINIDNDEFPGLVTVSPKTLASQLSKYVSRVEFNLHLMIQLPLKTIGQVLDIESSQNIKFIIHQESNIKKLVENIGEYHIYGLAIQVDSEPRDLDFYNQFKEIQLMTVQIGYQGSKFQKNVLNRVEWLRSKGYKGKISIDGGVDLRSASIIREYDLDRVSVGSYFSKLSSEEEVKEAKDKLSVGLNM